MSQPGDDILTPIGGAWLPRESLVVGAPFVSCAAGEAGISVVALAHSYRWPDRAHTTASTAGCVNADHLTPAAGMRLRTLSRDPNAPIIPDAPAAGVLSDPLPEAIDCGPDATVLAWPRHSLRDAKVVTDTQVAIHHQVLTQLRAAVGDVPPSAIEVNDFGRVSLPLTRWYTDAELQAARTRESLDTPTRAEKVPVAEGPAGDWLHFTGADAHRSDIWADPAAVVDFAALFHGWQAHCAARFDPWACVVQVGDLGWYSARLPDPLGHSDHFAGTCADLRLFRDDGSRYEAYWNREDDRPGRHGGYSQALMTAFVAYAHTTHKFDRMLFNDPDVPGVSAARGHNDHLHICARGSADGHPTPPRDAQIP